MPDPIPVYLPNTYGERVVVGQAYQVDQQIVIHIRDEALRAHLLNMIGQPWVEGLSFVLYEVGLKDVGLSVV